MKGLDYNKGYFKRKVNENGEVNYYFRIKNEYVEVSKEIYDVCMRSYSKMKYDRNRSAEHPMVQYETIEESALFYFVDLKEDFVNDVYMNELAEIIKKGIEQLDDKYRDIAIAIFLNEMTEREVSEQLHIPKTTIHKRKVKIQKYLQEIIKKGTKV